METILNFAYTGHLTLGDDLMENANHIIITEVVEKCTKFFKSHCPPEKAFKIYRIAEKFGCESLMEQSSLVFHRQFGEACKSDEFLQLNFEFLQNILCSQEICDIPAESVFEGIIRWMGHDIHERKSHAGDLLKYVQFNDFIPEYFLRFFVRDDMATTYKHGDLLVNIMVAFKESRTIVTRPDKVTHFIVVNLWYSNDITIYNTHDDQWKSVKSQLPASHEVFNCGVVENDLYAVGGRKNQQYSADAHVYLPTKNLWKKISDMKYKRSLPAVAGLNGCLYVCGGYAGGKCLKVVERYRKDNNTWKILKPMNRCRSEAAAVVHDGYIYVIGGYDGSQSLKTIERYDQRQKRWSLMEAEMIENRRGCAAAVLNGMIYICGGRNDHGCLSSTEVYNLAEDKLVTTANMNEARWNFLLIAHKCKLWAIGDSDQDEVFNPVENKWIVCDWERPSLNNWIVGGAPSEISFAINNEITPQVEKLRAS